MIESAWVVPVMCNKISLLASWYTTFCNSDAENDKADDCNDFDDGEDELCLAISADPEEIDSDDDNPEYNHKSSEVDVLRTWPV